jgi:hypothetical protein
MPKTLSRAEALSLELTAYFTGVPCRSFHRAERSVKNGECLECQKANQKRWQEKNSDRVRADRKRRYWENPEKARAEATEWRRRRSQEQ